MGRSSIFQSLEKETMMKNSYPYEKFSNAVHGMAVSPSTIQKRIADAYADHLIYLKPEELPEEIRYKFNEFQHRLTSVESLGNEGRIYASTNEMDTNEAVQIAHSILYMADIVESDYRND
jgi:hypothetical protein